LIVGLGGEVGRLLRIASKVIRLLEDKLARIVEGAGAVGPAIISKAAMNRATKPRSIRFKPCVLRIGISLSAQSV